MAKKKSRLASSGRRIGKALFIVGLALLVSTTGARLAYLCTTGACAAAVFGVSSFDVGSIQSNFTLSHQTPPYAASFAGYSLLDLGQAVTQTGIYAVMVGLLVLIAMEFVELRYLRAVLRKSKSRKAVA